MTSHGSSEPVKRVAVVGVPSIGPGRELLSNLERVIPVRFELCRPSDVHGVDAIVLDTSDGEPSSCDDIPLPRFIAGRVVEGDPAPVTFGHATCLDRRLRGATLTDQCAGALPGVPVRSGDSVLARSGDKAIWVRRKAGTGPVDVVASSPFGPQSGGPLRQLLQADRFLGLLPLVHFLREVTRDVAWKPPPLRAAFVFDDPNLHARSYGYISYREMARHARAHRYHAAMAMIPLDTWFVARTARQLFADERDVLSLLIHGNDHLRHELERLQSARDASAVLSQALWRIAAFESRTGLAVSRVLVAPHERTSTSVRRAMLHLDYDALCISRKSPWAYHVGADRSVAGWHPADLFADSAPVITRQHITGSRDELVLRAYLDQPLVVYGHHDDLADGLDVLAELAAAINVLGDVHWQSLGDIARSNASTRIVGDVLQIRPHARTVRVTPPPGTSALQLEVPMFAGPSSMTATIGAETVPLAPAAGGWHSPIAEVTDGTPIDITLHWPRDDADAPRRRRRLRLSAMTRRAFTEGRDRASAARRRL